jgi:hypothetical protein
MSNSSSFPTQIPPAKQQTNTAASGQTTPMENTSMASVGNIAASTPAAPSQTPPLSSTVAGSARGGIATTWSSAATLNALWCINEDRNSWIGVTGIGWLKLSNASDSGIVALTMFSSHAKQLGSTVDYRQEDDGMIHEMYAW